MLPIWDFHQCHHFKHDGAPTRKSKLVKRFLEDREIPIWEWPVNSLYLNPIENAWNLNRNNAQEKQPTTITDLNEMLTDLWVHMNLDYFIKLAQFMLNRFQNVIKANIHMTINLLYIEYGINLVDYVKTRVFLSHFYPMKISLAATVYIYIYK